MPTVRVDWRHHPLMWCSSAHGNHMYTVFPTQKQVILPTMNNCKHTVLITLYLDYSSLHLLGMDQSAC